MALKLKGDRPAPGAVDRRYYMLDLQHTGRRVRFSTGTRDKALAERREQAVLDALREAPDASDDHLRAVARGAALATVQAASRAAAGWTFKQACDECLGDRKHGWGEAKAVETYATNCRQLQKAIGAARPVMEVDQDVLDEALQSFLDGGNSVATVNRKAFALLRVLKYAKRHGQYPEAIPEWVPHDEEGRSREFVLTADDEAVLFGAVAALDDREMPPQGGHPVIADAHHYVDVFTFLADIGCRHSQAYLVRWRDIVELEPGVLGVRFWRAGEQKGGRQRTVPCTSRVAEMLKRRLEAFGATSTGPFTGLCRFRATKLWRLAKQATHLKGEAECVPHALRHTCATRLLERTGDLKLVQEWLGHTKIETTGNIYTKVMVSKQLAAVSFLDDDRQVSLVPKAGPFQDRNRSQDRDSTTVTH